MTEGKMQKNLQKSIKIEIFAIASKTAKYITTLILNM